MQVKLPPLGEGATSGTVSGILVKVGDQVSKGQPLIELESEKAVAPIPAPSAGVVLEILVAEGEELKVGQPILMLSGDTPAKEKEISTKKSGWAVEAEQRESGGPPAPVAEMPVAPPPGFPPPAGPSVRKFARDLGIDLARVRGSERGGRIVMADLKDYIRRLQEGGSEQALPTSRPPTTPLTDFSRWGHVKRVKMSTLRQTIARRMTESWATIPHVTQFELADTTGLQRLRKIHKPFYKSKNVRLTITPFVMKALVDVLKEYPQFNASLDPSTNEIVLKEYYDFGIAVDTENGLIVPVIRAVDQKSLLQLAIELEDSANRARSRTLAMEEMQGGTFTISNQGGIGGGHFTPIINAPEVAILGIGRGTEQSVLLGARTAKRMMVPLALSYDHRMIDGADAVRFMTALTARLGAFKDAEVRLARTDNE